MRYVTLIFIFIFLIKQNTTFNIKLAQDLIKYSAAVGCQTNQIVNWNCYPCKLVSKLTDVTVIQGQNGDSMGYLGYSRQYNATILVFRGTSSLTNVLTNLAMFYKNYQRCNNNFDCKVHSGFYNTYLQIQSAVHQQIANMTLYYGNRLIITGLSLGGALATHAAAHLLSLGYNVAQLYTYGSPRVGNRDFHLWFNSVYGNRFIARIVHYNDPIPRLPAGNGYQHIGTQIFLNKDSSSYKICSWQQEDSNCSKKISFLTTNLAMHTTYWDTDVKQLVSYCN